jgi:hypothetical protein
MSSCPLVARALAALQADHRLLARWRERCSELLVDDQGRSLPDDLQIRAPRPSWWLR